jgi:leukotriene-A4 hydrolase
VKDYVNTFIGKSITTQEWKAHLYGYYEKHGGADKIKALDSVDWNVGDDNLTSAFELIGIFRLGFMEKASSSPSKWNMMLAWPKKLMP